jgi:hypothetical protein
MIPDEAITPNRALRLLADMGASPWLVRHHELVLEAATLLCSLVRSKLGVTFDREQVLVGAAVHDAGKIVHPEEMSQPGHLHESAGERLLIEHGIPARLARFCVTHASWSGVGISIEDLLVALADKLWKGKRDDALERRIADVMADDVEREAWEVFDALDSICEAIAADGPARLARSVEN